jgi:glutamyl-tRNA synthetase
MTANATDDKCRILVSKGDLSILKPGAVVRLMDLFNFTVNQVSQGGVTGELHSETYAEAKKVNAPLIQWLPEQQNCEASVMMPTAEKINGLGEPALLSCHVDEVIQFVRFGFSRVDAVLQDSVELYFAHQ